MFFGNKGLEEEEEKSDSTKAREAFFLDFARIIRKEFPDVPLMVTGGFSTRVGMEKAVADGDCDMIGLGRPAVINPSLPNNVVFNPELKDEDATLFRKKNPIPWIVKQLGIKAIGAGIDSVCFVASTVTTEP
jgi:2,4-dienoyl-CoA reductase-like NADH-dependent reductase (Old Yellow Enzyme family)